MKISSIALGAAFILALNAVASAQQTTPAATPGTTTQQTTTTTTTTTVPSTTTNDPDADIDDNAAMGPNNQYGDPMCGTWSNGTFTANGHCPGYAVGPHRARVAGTITAVKGHLVTVQQATRTVVIDDTPALNRQSTGKVAVGRQIVAYGYWVQQNFFATAIH